MLRTRSEETTVRMACARRFRNELRVLPSSPLDIYVALVDVDTGKQYLETVVPAGTPFGGSVKAVKLCNSSADASYVYVELFMGSDAVIGECQ